MERAIEVLAVALLLIAAATILLARGKRRASAPPVVDVQKRRFLNRALVGSLGMFAVALGGGSIAFIWPEVRRGFGSVIVAGKHKSLLAEIEAAGRPIYNTGGRFYLVRYDGSDPDGFYKDAGVLSGGLMAIYQKCSHLGCRVPFCPTSGWFECPCHGTRFNGAGEWKGGPALGGLWRFPIYVDDDGSVVVDTHRPIALPPKGVDTIGRGPAGPFCVDY